MAVDIPLFARGSTWPVTITIAAVLRASGYDAAVLVAIGAGLLVYSLACLWDQVSGDIRPRAALAVLGPISLCVWFGILLGAVFEQSDNLPWYQAYYDHCDWLLYSILAILLYIVMHNVWSFCHTCTILKSQTSNAMQSFMLVANGPYVFIVPSTATRRCSSLLDAVYARRCAIMNAVAAICAAFTVYYADIVIRYVVENEDINMADTTYYSSWNKTQCGENDDMVTQVDDALYSEIKFVKECAVMVWARNRTNLLVWMQASVVFSLLVHVPYLSKHVKPSYRAWYVLAMVVSNIGLALAVITTLDLLTAWYDISTTGAVLFAVYGVSRVVASIVLYMHKCDTTYFGHDGIQGHTEDVKLKL